MRVSCSCAIVLALMTCKSAWPDTVTTKENLSTNGSVVGMSDGVVKIRARYPSGEKEVWFQVKAVQSIEFNSLTFNPGAPPKTVGFGPPADQNASQKEPPEAFVVVLRGGRRQPCILVGIDADRVHCGPKDAGYARSAVLRIVFGSE